MIAHGFFTWKGDFTISLISFVLRSCSWFSIVLMQFSVRLARVDTNFVFTYPTLVIGERAQG